MSNGFLTPFAFDGTGSSQFNLLSTDTTTVSWEFYNKNRTLTLSAYRFVDAAGHTGPAIQVASGLPSKDQYKWRPADSLNLDSHDLGSFKLAISFDDDDEAIGSGPFEIHGPDYTATTGASQASSSASSTPQSGSLSSAPVSDGSGSSTNHTAVIVGSTIGASLFLVIMMAAFFLTWNKRRDRLARVHGQPNHVKSQALSMVSNEKALPPSPSERKVIKGSYHEMSCEVEPSELAPAAVHEMDAGKVAELAV